jgi:hypothetical protein
MRSVARNNNNNNKDNNSIDSKPRRGGGGTSEAAREGGGDRRREGDRLALEGQQPHPEEGTQPLQAREGPSGTSLRVE